MAVAIRTGQADSSGGRRGAHQGLAPPLSRREWEVLAEVSKGATNQEIAIGLGVSVHTVRSYLKTILLKLDAKNRTAAATWFERHRHEPALSSHRSVAPLRHPDRLPQARH